MCYSILFLAPSTKKTTFQLSIKVLIQKVIFGSYLCDVTQRSCVSFFYVKDNKTIRRDKCGGEGGGRDHINYL